MGEGINATPWLDFYQSDLQSLWLLWIAPGVFLAWRLAFRPRVPGPPAAAAFLSLWTWLFAVETLVDPLATGPVTGWLGWSGATAGSALMFVLVWLGDFRVLWLVFGVASPAEASGPGVRKAAVWTCFVPVWAGVAYLVLHNVVPAAHGQWLWVLYEAGFLVLALYLGIRWVPGNVADAGARRMLRRVTAYVAVYYALWAAADLVILVAGRDEGWALRALPNQLYYAFFVPFVWIAAAGQRSD